jgi:hypothetical protein
MDLLITYGSPRRDGEACPGRPPWEGGTSLSAIALQNRESTFARRADPPAGTVVRVPVDPLEKGVQIQQHVGRFFVPP